MENADSAGHTEYGGNGVCDPAQAESLAFLNSSREFQEEKEIFVPVLLREEFSWKVEPIKIFLQR
jgi:hypothetical protein